MWRGSAAVRGAPGSGFRRGLAPNLGPRLAGGGGQKADGVGNRAQAFQCFDANFLFAISAGGHVPGRMRGQLSDKL